MKKIILIGFVAIAFNISSIEARMTSPEPDGRDHPPEIGEIDLYFNTYATQDVPKSEDINKARARFAGSGSGSNPCGNRHPGSTTRSDVACGIEQFTSTFATQNVPDIPHENKNIKYVKDGQRGNNQAEFVNKEQPDATGSGQSNHSSTQH